MRRTFTLLILLATLSTIAKADSKETVTINGKAVNKSATHLTFSGDEVSLTFSDGSTQTADISEVSIDFDHVAVFKDSDYDNAETIKIYGGKTLQAEVTRAFKVGEWATICLPFSMSASDITTSFGSGTQVAFLESATSSAINFTLVEKMTSGMPYLIKPTKDVTSFTLNSVEIGDFQTGNTLEGKDIKFTGAIQAVANDNNMYYIASGNKFCHLTSGTILPLHAFFVAANSSSKGDANGDNKVNVADVMISVNYVLEQQPSLFIFANADINNDGNVNVSDVMSIIGIILNGGQAVKTDIPFTIDGVAINITDGGEGTSNDQAANQSEIEQTLF